VPPAFRGRQRTGHCSPQFILSVITAAAEDGQVGEQGSGLLRVLRDVWCECGGVTGDERVRVMKSPARRSRAGLGVHGVAGVLILS
jgi:hypothetical protein